MKIGFTGTRRGLTEPQAAALRRLLDELGDFELHHGNAVGADEQAALLAEGAGVRTVAHPCTLASQQSRRTAPDETRRPLPPLERNLSIVSECDVLIACPLTAEELRRSGTWATCRYARRAGRSVRLVLPDGTVREEAPHAL